MNVDRGRESNCSGLHFLLVGEPQLSLALSLNERDFIFACTLQVPWTMTATTERGTMSTRFTRSREGWAPVGRARRTRRCCTRTRRPRTTSRRRRTTRPRRSRAPPSSSPASRSSLSAPDRTRSPRTTM